MINFLVIQVREFCENFIHHLIVRLKISVQILLLDEIHPDSLVPIKFTNSGKKSLILLIGENFKAKKYKAYWQWGMLYFYFFINLVNSLHKFFLVMQLDQFSRLIVFCKLAKEGSELNSIISIFNVFS